MPIARFIVPGAFYHVTGRVNHKERLFASPIAKTIFIETLAIIRRKHECVVADFVVMENHIHLIIKPLGNSSLGDCMKWLLGVYTMGYNRVFKTWGRVWGGRCFSRPIHGIGDMASTIAYIDRTTRTCLSPFPSLHPLSTFQFSSASRIQGRDVVLSHERIPRGG